MDAATLYLYISMGLNMVLYLIVGMYLIKRAIDKKIYSMVYFAILLILISLCFVAYIIAGGAS
ncbi:MAG: hypothetical protein GY870_00860, partial [archaeon]|nr:hypothetical protein [archaeon]